MAPKELKDVRALSAPPECAGSSALNRKDEGGREGEREIRCFHDQIYRLLTDEVNCSLSLSSSNSLRISLSMSTRIPAGSRVSLSLIL